jgi:hypothetical protein
MDPSGWQSSFSSIATTVFTARFLYHSRETSSDSPVCFLPFATKLLQSTIQLLLIILCPAERLSAPYSFYSVVASSLLDTAASELLSCSDASLDFFRSLFRQSSVFDSWLQSTELLNLAPLCDRIFATCGHAWMALEISSLPSLSPDFPLAASAALSSIVDALPGCVSPQNRSIFFSECVVPAEQALIAEIAECENPLFEANCFYMVGAKVAELFELGDGECAALSKDAAAARERAKEICKSAAEDAGREFVLRLQAYLGPKRLRKRDGISPELIAALEWARGKVEEARAVLEPVLFRREFATALAGFVDEKVARFMVGFEWKAASAVAQFGIDFEAMVEVFGIHELRKLRSVRLALNRRGEGGFQYELSEKDWETLIEATESI